MTTPTATATGPQVPAAAPLADISWLPFAVLGVIFAVLSWIVFRDHLASRRPTPSVSATAARSSTVPGGAVEDRVERLSRSPRVRAAAIADWSMAQASIPAGASDLIRWPPSGPELAAADLYDGACNSPTFNEPAVHETWDELVSIAGSPGRALLLASRAARKRRDSIATLDRAFGASR